MKLFGGGSKARKIAHKISFSMDLKSLLATLRNN